MTFLPHDSTTNLIFTKHHGLGNDFLIAVQPRRPLNAADAIHLCDRRRGFGADGLIQLTTGPDSGLNGAPSASSLWEMTLWNADGSEAEISGNGIRCVGQALVQHLDLSGDQPLLVRTAAGLRQLYVHETPREDEHQVRVDMGGVTDGPGESTRFAELGVAVDRQTTLDIGNPHLVVLTDDIDAVDVAAVGPVVEADYPDGINVHFIRVDNPSTISLRVWERGAGITEACGSGACAAAVAAHRWGLTGSTVKVSMPGGSAEVEVAESIFLTGPATFVGTVIVNG